MLGAVVGDIIGSVYENDNVKSKDFPFITDNTHFTDDTVMTLAIAKWLMTDSDRSTDGLVEIMQEFGRKYPDAGYGRAFHAWIFSEMPEHYNSWANGSAMRVSPIGLCASTIEETLHLAKISAEVTHNHPEGIKGAQAVAACVFLYRNGYTKNEIKDFVEREFGYNLSRTLDNIRPVYKFDVSCQGSVPESIIAFLESDTLEECVRNAISIGGDSDTIASIACAIYMSRKDIDSNDKWCEEYSSYLTADLLDVMREFESMIDEKTSF